jgi:hypothetical protein
MLPTLVAAFFPEAAAREPPGEHMIRMLLAAAAALALVSAAPALGCPNCNTPECPMHKAAADKAAKKAGDVKAACACAGEGKECTCGAQCDCPHCAAKKAEKKEAGKKS